MSDFISENLQQSLTQPNIIINIISEQFDNNIQLQNITNSQILSKLITYDNMKYYVVVVLNHVINTDTSHKKIEKYANVFYDSLNMIDNIEIYY